jgi:hypothetical protein
MATNILKTEFAKFIFIDDQTVIAEAYDGVNIDGKKIRFAIDLIENNVPGDYALILNRKADYSVVPVEVYKFLASLERLKAIAIVRYKARDFLPENMEAILFEGNIKKFFSINEAHEWIKTVFQK